LAVFRRAGDLVGLAETLFSLGALRRDQGRDDDSMVCYQQALMLEEQLGNRLNQALLLCSIGSILTTQSRLGEAQATLRRGLELAAGAQPAEGFSLAFLGEAEVRAGKTDQAHEHLDTAFGIFQRVRDRYGEALTLRNFGELYTATEQFTQARAAIDRSLALWEQLQAPMWQARTLVTLGRLQAAAGESFAARETWQRADTLYERLGSLERRQVRMLLCQTEPVWTNQRS
jgi:tetratricopeptide (TPR) repeat protein